jgi:hypothetical protein
MVVFKTRFASQVCHLQLVRSARLLKVQFTEGELCSADGVAKRIGTGKGGYIYIHMIWPLGFPGNSGIIWVLDYMIYGICY